MRKKKILGQIDVLVAKNSELYNDNVALAKELENKKALIGELEDKLRSLETALEEAKTAPSVSVETETGDSDIVAEEEPDVTENATQDAECSIEIESEEIGTTMSPDAVDAEQTVTTQNSAVIDSASAVIGMIVIECAELCNIFTSHGGPNAKDLVNLALGRTEVFKSEILQLVNEYDDLADAKAEVDLQVASIREYFELLKKQL